MHFRILIVSIEAQSLRYAFLSEKQVQAKTEVMPLTPAETAPTSVETVGVVGGGFMGCGIVCCLVMAGYSVIVTDVTDVSGT